MIITTVKPVLVATCIKQATCYCIKQACIQFLQKANTLKNTCLKQAYVLSKQLFDYPLGACLIQVGLYLFFAHLNQSGSGW